MKEKFINGLSILLIFGFIAGVFVAIVAIEIAALLLVGFEYNHWQSLAIFILIYSIVEFILSSAMKVILKQKAKGNYNLHYFFCNLIISFTVLMGTTLLLDSVYIPVAGAVIFSIITAILYSLMERLDKPDNKA